MAAIDTIRPVTTPEGIDLPIRPAGPVARARAWVIDLFIRGAILLVLFVLIHWLPVLGGVGIGLLFLVWFLVNWWYPVLFEVLRDGATPGKAAVGLRVVHLDATPVGWGASLVRNLLRQIDFLPFGYATGLVALLCNDRFQRLGDLAAGTLVVYRDRAPENAALGLLPALAGRAAEPPPVRLTRQEQQALLSLAERLPRLNPQRAEELADHLSPLTGARGREGLERVLGWARWAAGGQGA